MKTLLLFAALVFLLCGCNATTGAQGVCAVAPMGQNEEGVVFVRYKCVPE
jgi:hypothetical protein